MNTPKKCRAFLIGKILVIHNPFSGKRNRFDVFKHGWKRDIEIYTRIGCELTFGLACKIAMAAAEAK